jgi:hypothetical protein
MTISRATMLIGAAVFFTATFAGACGDHQSTVQTTCCGGRTVYQHVCVGIGTGCDSFGSLRSCSSDCDLVEAGTCMPPKVKQETSSTFLLDVADRQLLASKETRNGCGLRGAKLEEWIQQVTSKK